MRRQTRKGGKSTYQKSKTRKKTKPKPKSQNAEKKSQSGFPQPLTSIPIFRKLSLDCLQAHWIKEKDREKLGEGMNAEIFAMCPNSWNDAQKKDCPFILKKGSYRELVCTVFASIHGVSPPVYEVGRCNKLGEDASDQLKEELGGTDVVWWVQKLVPGAMTLESFVVKKLREESKTKAGIASSSAMILDLWNLSKRAAEMLVKYKMNHNDLHDRNWLVSRTYNKAGSPMLSLQLIDFGRTTVQIPIKERFFKNAVGFASQNRKYMKVVEQMEEEEQPLPTIDWIVGVYNEMVWRFLIQASYELGATQEEKDMLDKLEEESETILNKYKKQQKQLYPTLELWNEIGALYEKYLKTKSWKE